jgi:hypothetical protein
VTLSRFSDHTGIIRQTLPARVAAQLKADLPQRLTRSAAPSSHVLAQLMRSWHIFQSELFIQMVHEIAEISRQPAKFYGPPIVSWSGTSQTIRCAQLRFEQLPIGDGDNTVCSWEGFISSLLMGPDGVWFREQLEEHDRSVTATSP